MCVLLLATSPREIDVIGLLLKWCRRPPWVLQGRTPRGPELARPRFRLSEETQLLAAFRHQTPTDPMGQAEWAVGLIGQN